MRRRDAEKAARAAAETTVDATAESTTDRRSKGDTAAELGDEVAGAQPRGYTPSKKDLGQVTPKRRAGGRGAEPPPANRREALKRMRVKQRESRAEARAGMMAGKEEFLPPRDKGPERALVRDIVDARRNVASYFIPVALLVIVGSSGAMPPAVQWGSNILWALLALGVVADSFLISRKVKRMLAERFPRNPVPARSYYFYAIIRSLSFRRMRVPAARVKVGQKI